MTRLNTCPYDRGDIKPGSVDILAITFHRTYGSWPGDYATIKNNGLAQFLVGKDEGNWVEFADAEEVQYHCNGSNFKSFGIEIEGINEDSMTDWQIARVAEILKWANSSFGVPLTYLDPFSAPPASVHVNDGNYKGLISHYSVQTDDGTSQHSDIVTMTDYNKIMVAVGGEIPKPPPEEISQEDQMLYKENKDGGGHQFYLGTSGGLLPLTDGEAYAHALSGMKVVEYPTLGIIGLSTRMAQVFQKALKATSLPPLGPGTNK